MKTIKMFVAICIVISGVAARGQSHHDPAVKHNMLMFGEGEVFLSHIVYKQPHNFQVVVKIEPDVSVKKVYFNERQKYPDQEYIFLLDHMHIGEIQSAESLSGRIFRRDSNGVKTILFEHVLLAKNQFKVLYMAELPLNLGPE